MKSRKIILSVSGLVLLIILIGVGFRQQGKDLAVKAIQSALLKANQRVFQGKDMGNVGELDRLGLFYNTDKARDHHYTELYEYFLRQWKDRPLKIFEIGILGGASIKMWRDYFPRSTYYGIDILDESKFNSETVKTFIADQADRNKLQEFINAYGGGFDFILDDGGHSMEQQQVSFGFLFKQVKPGGFYIIEDVHTSIYAHHGNEYGATENGEKTTLAMIDNYIRTGCIKSTYMTKEEENDLTSHIEYCNLFSRDNGKSITCIFRKKKEQPGKS